MPASDVGHLRPLLEFADDAIERRQPILHKRIDVTRAEQPRDGTEHAAGLIAPGDAPTGFEGGLHFRLVLGHRSCGIERADQIDRAVGFAKTKDCSGVSENRPCS